jgi:hypothetical protein
MARIGQLLMNSILRLRTPSIGARTPEASSQNPSRPTIKDATLRLMLLPRATIDTYCAANFAEVVLRHVQTYCSFKILKLLAESC